MAVFQEEEFYHIYNQGNNKQTIFLDEGNYAYFLSLAEKLIAPKCEIISWCLMPNHFHLLVKTNSESVRKKSVGSLILTELSNAIRVLQSNYTLAFNKKNNRTGSLFRQKFKAKLIDTNNDSKYLITCFQYIHQNPLKAGLVQRMEDWKYSSFSLYKDLSESTFTCVDKGIKYLDLDMGLFYYDSYRILDEDLLDKIILED